MINKVHGGSIVLMMLFLITTITVVLISTLRSQAHFIALAREREEYEKNYTIAESLLKYGIKIYSRQQKQKDPLNTDEEVIRFDNSPLRHIYGNQADLYGTLSVKNDTNKRIFRLNLIKEDTIIISLQTEMEK